MNRLIVVALVVAPAVSSAHDFWVEPAPEGFLVRYGHRGAEALPIDAATVKAIRCADGSAEPRDVRAAARFEPKEILVPVACQLLSVFHDGGFWSLTPSGEVNLPKDKVNDAVRSWASRQYAKWVDARSPRAGAVLADELELVPVTDLSRVHEGDKITLRVLSAGQPVPNAVVSIGHNPIGETDSMGEVRLRVRTAGVESISTSVKRRHETAQADAEVLEASLTFEVAR